MDWRLLSLTLGPGLAICIYIYWRDKYDKEPLGLLIKSFIGGAFSAFLALFLSKKLAIIFPSNSLDIVDTALYSFVTVALSEEFAKLVFLLVIVYRKVYFDEPSDGITYSVMVAMGFATLENALYVFNQKTAVDSYNVAIARMLTAVPAHASFGVLMGYFVGFAKFSKFNAIPYLFIAWISAAIMHGLYDFFLIQQSYPQMAIGALVSLVVSLVLSKKAIRIHQENSPFKL